MGDKKRKFLTIQVRDYGDEEVNRLGIVDGALSKMEKPERERALRFFKSKYSAEWPSDSTY